MTQQTSGYSASAGSYNDPSTKDVAREQAAEVGRTTGAAGQRVANTAAEQAARSGRKPDGRPAIYSVRPVGR